MRRKDEHPFKERLEEMRGGFRSILDEHESAQMAARPAERVHRMSIFARICYWWERGSDVKR